MTTDIYKATRTSGYWPHPSYLEILPVDPAYICVPVYDPVIVFRARWGASS